MVFNYEGSMVYLTGYDLINPFMRSLRINGSCYKFVLKKIGSFWWWEKSWNKICVLISTIFFFNGSYFFHDFFEIPARAHSGRNRVEIEYNIRTLEDDQASASLLINKSFGKIREKGLNRASIGKIDDEDD